ncbi:hypothetical protein V2G26_021273 [Clonostachys chloroleuca]
MKGLLCVTFLALIAQTLQATLPAADLAQSPALPALQARQDRRCGPEVARSCPQAQCCSSGGWCGTGSQFCRSPTCQIDYGPSCDANIRPEGPDTSSVPRPKVGSVPYGKAIYDCTVKGGIALTFDDGPWNYTEDLLDLLAEYDAKATFFVVGRNAGKGAINDPSTPWPALIRRMVDDGHQIASHTWAHHKLTQITPSQFRDQILFNEVALADLLGYFPTYMRPPHSMSDATTDAWLAELGYHVAYFDLNTAGYLNDGPELIKKSIGIWDGRVEPLDPATSSLLVIEHDTVYHGVYTLARHMLETVKRKGFRTLTVGECLGDPKENWYREVASRNTEE